MFRTNINTYNINKKILERVSIMFIVGFIAGSFFGGILILLVMSCIVVAGQADNINYK